LQGLLDKRLSKVSKRRAGVAEVDVTPQQAYLDLLPELEQVA